MTSSDASLTALPLPLAALGLAVVSPSLVLIARGPIARVIHDDVLELSLSQQPPPSLLLAAASGVRPAQVFDRRVDAFGLAVAKNRREQLRVELDGSGRVSVRERVRPHGEHVDSRAEHRSGVAACKDFPKHS